MKRNKKQHIIFIITLISIVSITLVPMVTSTNEHTNTIIYVDDDGTADFICIQDAINASNDGDTVFVYTGLYVEHIEIDTSINLIGEDKEITIIDGGDDTNVVYISADGVSISGFTIQNCGIDAYWRDPYSGIKINSSYNQIFDNIVTSNKNGIQIQHSHNIIRNNIIHNNLQAIYVLEGESTIIEQNDIYDNQGYDRFAIYLYKTSNTEITQNNIRDNQCGIHSLWSSKINITKNQIRSNNKSLTLFEGSDILIKHNHIKDGSIGLVECQSDISRNNILVDDIHLLGVKWCWDSDKYDFGIGISANRWRHNYWGPLHPFIKIISFRQPERFYVYYYLDTDWNPAHRPFIISETNLNI